MSQWICACLLLFGAWSCATSKTSTPDPGPSEGHTPERIISLAPSVTEILLALDQTHRMVGRDKFSVNPPEILKLPSLGDFLVPNIEAVVGLTPDLVLLDESQARANDALRELGVTTLRLPMHQLSDVRSGLIRVGRAVGARDRAREVVAALDVQVQHYAARGQDRSEHPTVLVIIDRDPDTLRNVIAAGPKTYLDELLTLVGVRNMMSGSVVRYPQISAEQILRSAPDIIIDLSKTQGGLDAYESIREAPAVRNRRVHILQDALLLSPTPQVGRALERLYALTGPASTL